METPVIIKQKDKEILVTYLEPRLVKEVSEFMAKVGTGYAHKKRPLFIAQLKKRQQVSMLFSDTTEEENKPT